MDPKHRISVIIPTYNRADSIVGSIESVLAQTYPIAEVIVADDGSKDDTEEKIRLLGDARVKYFKLPQNRGAGGARNFGVEQASCEWIAFHDSDDFWLPEKIEKQIQLLEGNPDAGLVYSAYRIHLSDGRERIIPDPNRGAGLSGNIFQNLLLQNTIGAPTVLMRKSVFYEVGGFDETMRSLEDWDFALKVAGRYEIAFVPEPLVEVMQTQGGVSSQGAAYYQNRCYLLKKYRRHYLETETFNTAAGEILRLADGDGIRAQVEKLMMLYMSQGDE